jgi:hypothetical protein
VTGSRRRVIVEPQPQRERKVGNAMYRTIQLSSCISVQGEIVEALLDGTVLIRDGETIYRGRPIELRAETPPKARKLKPRLEPAAAG